MNYGDILKKKNPIIYKTIKNAYKNKKLAHSYIFSSDHNLIINYEPLFLIQTLISEKPFSEEVRKIESYPDLVILDGSEASILKQQVLDAMSQLSKKPLEENGVKILYIKNIENANKHSLNSLLKFIEEPMPNTYIVITTNNIAEVLSTIKSRSQIINIKKQSIKNLKINFQEADIDKKYINLLSILTNGITEAQELLKDKLFISCWNKIIKIGETSLKDHNVIIQELSQFITKTNVHLFLRMYLEFFVDIYKYESEIETSFHLDKLYDTYINKDFPYYKVFELINNFYNSIHINLNFELIKTHFLIKLGELYE